MYCCAKPNLTEKRTVLIVGGGNGIGYCLTKTLLDTTYDNIISCDIDIKSSLGKLHREHSSNRFHISYIDVTDTLSIQKCMDNIKNAKIEYIDRIVLCCGLFNGAPLLEISEKDFTTTMNVNVIGIWRVIKLLYTNGLIKYDTDRNNNSRIIVISSELASCHPVPFGEPYGLSKSCLQDLCRTLKIELSTINVDVITINPGAVDTQLLTVMESKFARADKNSPFTESCEFAIKCKNSARKYSSCSDTQYIVDNTLLYAIHCNYKYTKSEYYIGRTWVNYLQPYIPNVVYDSLMINLFYLWSKCCKKKNKNVEKKDQ
eukprot:304341_1